MKADVSFSDACSSSILRSSNGVLAVFCSMMVYNILTHLRPSLTDRKVTLRTVVLALYPLHWFFTFLYYTDVASLTAVLASYLMSLKKKYFFSSLVRGSTQSHLILLVDNNGEQSYKLTFIQTLYSPFLVIELFSSL